LVEVSSTRVTYDRLDGRQSIQSGLERPMIDVTHTVTIDRPVSEVFDFVAESSNEPKWDVDVEEVVQPSQGPLTAGTRFEWVLKLLGTKRIAGEVTAFESNRLIELTTYETSGLLKLLEPLIKRMPRNPNTRTAENLKLVLEGGQPR